MKRHNTVNIILSVSLILIYITICIIDKSYICHFNIAAKPNCSMQITNLIGDIFNILCNLYKVVALISINSSVLSIIKNYKLKDKKQLILSIVLLIINILVILLSFTNFNNNGISYTASKI